MVAQPLTPELVKQRETDLCEFKSSHRYALRPCLKTKQQTLELYPKGSQEKFRIFLNTFLKDFFLCVYQVTAWELYMFVNWHVGAKYQVLCKNSKHS